MPHIAGFGITAVLALRMAGAAAEDERPANERAGDEYVAPRGVHPDLNGIWQALNEANYDIELHMARASMQLRDGPHSPLPSVDTYRLGAVVGVPAPTDSWMDQSVASWEGDTLLRRGLTRDSLVPGTFIIVDGYQGEDRSVRANGPDITFAEGRDPTEPPLPPRDR